MWSEQELQNIVKNAKLQFEEPELFATVVLDLEKKHGYFSHTDHHIQRSSTRKLDNVVTESFLESII